MVDGSSDDGAERERALWARVARAVLAQARPEDRALELLRYLEAFPTGRHNRRAAEAVEAALWRVADARVRASLRARLRAVRDPHLPPVEPDTWCGD